MTLFCLFIDKYMKRQLCTLTNHKASSVSIILYVFNIFAIGIKLVIFGYKPFLLSVKLHSTFLGLEFSFIVASSKSVIYQSY
jgi:uncharacterized membrane protein